MVLRKFSRFAKFQAVGYICVLILCKAKAIYLPRVDLRSKDMKHTHSLIFVCAYSNENSNVTCDPGLSLLTLNARSLCIFFLYFL